MADIDDKDESSGLGLGALAGVGSLAAGVIFRRPIGRFIRNYADDFIKETKARDLRSPLVKQQEFKEAKVETPLAEGRELITTDLPVEEEMVKTISAAKRIDNERKKYKAAMAKAEKENPMTLGGSAPDNEMYGVGSPLFRFLALQYPGVKGQPVSYWVDNFSKGKWSTEYMAEGVRHRVQISKAELADTNIAIFNRENKLVGGYLKYIDDINKLTTEKGAEIKVDPTTLMELIQKAPGNNLQFAKFSSQVQKRINNAFIQPTDELLEDIAKIDAKYGGSQKDNLRLSLEARDAGNPTEQVIQNGLFSLKNKLIRVKGQTSFGETVGSYQGTGTSPTENFYIHEGILDEIKKFKRDLLDLGETNNPQVQKIFQKLDDFDEPSRRQVLKDVDKRHAGFLRKRPEPDDYNQEAPVREGNVEGTFSGRRLKNTSSYTEYPLESQYRTLGGEHYNEDVAHVSKKGLSTLPGGLRMNAGHFSTGPGGESLSSQIYHVRWHERFVGAEGSQVGDDLVFKTVQNRTGDQPQKIWLVDEGQSDKQQGVANFVINKKRALAKQHLRALENAKRSARNEVNIREEDLDARLASMSPTAYADLYTKKSPTTAYSDFGEQFMFKPEQYQKNMFNLDTITSATYNDRLTTIVDEMSDIVAKGVSRTEEEGKRLIQLRNAFDELRQLIPEQQIQRQMTEVDYLPFQNRETWGGLMMKHMIRDAAEAGVDWVGIVPYEVGHHTRYGARKLGNLEFYGNAFGRGDLRKGPNTFVKLEGKASIPQPAGVPDDQGIVRDVTTTRDANAKGAVLPNALRKFANKHNTEVKVLRVYKSNPNKEVKFIREKSNASSDPNVQSSIDPLTGVEKPFREHVTAMTKDEYEALTSSLGDMRFSGGRHGKSLNLRDAKVEIRKKTGDRVEHTEDDFFLVYAIKVKPSFAKMPISSYKKGGLAVNLFKW